MGYGGLPSDWEQKEKAKVIQKFLKGTSSTVEGYEIEPFQEYYQVEYAKALKKAAGAAGGKAAKAAAKKSAKAAKKSAKAAAKSAAKKAADAAKAAAKKAGKAASKNASTIAKGAAGLAAAAGAYYVLSDSSDKASAKRKCEKNCKPINYTQLGDPEGVDKSKLVYMDLDTLQGDDIGMSLEEAQGQPVCVATTPNCKTFCKEECAELVGDSILGAGTKTVVGAGADAASAALTTAAPVVTDAAKTAAEIAADAAKDVGGGVLEGLGLDWDTIKWPLAGVGVLILLGLIAKFWPKSRPATATK